MHWPELDKKYLQEWVADLNLVAEWRTALRIAGLRNDSSSGES